MRAGLRVHYSVYPKLLRLLSMACKAVQGLAIMFPTLFCIVFSFMHYICYITFFKHLMVFSNMGDLCTLFPILGLLSPLFSPACLGRYANITTFDSKTPIVFSKVVLLRQCYHMIKRKESRAWKKGYRREGRKNVDPGLRQKGYLVILFGETYCEEAWRGLNFRI